MENTIISLSFFIKIHGWFTVQISVHETYCVQGIRKVVEKHDSRPSVRVSPVLCLLGCVSRPGPKGSLRVFPRTDPGSVDKK